MGSDTELSDDDIFDLDDKFFDCHPLPAECQNEVAGIESFYKCFINRYNACPAFFMGTLQEACESSFRSTVVKEHRPILVYIHHDKSLLSNIFCSNTFCSEIIIDYLLENYIVWPWDITYESNKTTLIDIWEKLSTQLLVNFSIEQCPMLIGIMQRSTGEKGWLSLFDYECTLLHHNDTLTRTQVKFSRERLLNELIIFKEQCDENEKILSFDFVKTTGLCWEVFLDITKYLYLNDIVYAFSSNILPFINKYNTKLHVSSPSNQFNNMLLQKIPLEKIVSLRFKTDYYGQGVDLASSAIFNNIISLTFVNLQDTNQIKECETYYPNLISLSLWYDYQGNYQLMANILRELRNPIKRFELHCTKPIHTRYFTNLSYSSDIQNRTIEFFLLDIGYFNSNSMNNFLQDYDTCFLIKTIDFIKCMINIRHVCLIVNHYNLERFLDGNGWKNLVNKCCQLRKITLQVIGDRSEDEQLTQNVQQIQTELCEVREKIKFQVIFK